MSVNEGFTHFALPNAAVQKMRRLRRRPPPHPVGALVRTQQSERPAETANRARQDRLETAAEIALAAFLKPFQLSDVDNAVHKLIGAGYTTTGALRAIDEQQLRIIALAPGDGDRVMLASWLQAVGLVQHGPGLVASHPPICSLLSLLRASDDQLKASGISTIGHRRQLQRHLREDEQVQAMAAREREAREAEKGAKQARGLYAGGGKRGSAGSRGGATDGHLSLDQHNAALQLRSLPGAGATYGPASARDAWHTPWRTMSNACLSNGPGELADSHYLADPLSVGSLVIGGSRVW